MTESHAWSTRRPGCGFLEARRLTSPTRQRGARHLARLPLSPSTVRLPLTPLACVPWADKWAWEGTNVAVWCTNDDGYSSNGHASFTLDSTPASQYTFPASTGPASFMCYKSSQLTNGLHTLSTLLPCSLKPRLLISSMQLLRTSTPAS